MAPSKIIENHDQVKSPLFDLPGEVILNLLQFLDVESIGALRLTSKSTKSWIETSPGFLRNLKIYIKDEDRMKEIMDSKVEWQNVIIPPSLCNAKCIPFLQRFASSISVIKIQRKETENGTFTTHGLDNFLASTSPCLKSLDVAEDLELWFLAGMLQFLGY